MATASGALAGPRSGPLLLASSSLNAGANADQGDFSGDYAAFADTVAEWLDWRGTVFTVSTACTSGLTALLSARTLLRHGAAGSALVLGLELRNRVTVGGFGAMQLLSARRALPCGRGRDGLMLGEAVAALHVTRTPARWRIAGGANVVDGRDPAGTSPDAVVGMCAAALADSGLTADAIDLIKLQAAGSPRNDAAEVRALKRVFQPLPALVSLKAVLGHTSGAAGAAEIALLTGCLERGVWPHIDYPQDTTLRAPLAPVAPPRVQHILACILGFGGGHAAVVLADGAA